MRIAGGALLLAILAALAIVTHRALNPAGTQYTDDAYVEGNFVQLTPQVTGTVVSIDADETDLVRQGEPLVELDPTDARVALLQPEAHLGAVVRTVDQLYENVGPLADEVVVHQVAVQKAEDDYRRRVDTASGSVSTEEVRHAAEGLSAARAALEAAQRRLDAARALTSNIDGAHQPLVLQAADRVREAYLALARTRVVAPVSGYVAPRSVQIGQRVAPGTPHLVIVPLHQIWVDANCREEQLRNVRIGQKVRLVADLYGDGVKYDGRVIGISAGTGGTFSLLPPQNATGNWIKVTQRLPVRIGLEAAQLEAHPLRLGLSMSVSIDTHDRSGPPLAASVARQPVYSTTVYADQPKQSGEIIDRIIAANLGAAEASRAGSDGPKALRGRLPLANGE